MISLLNLIGFLRLLFLAGVNQLTNKDIFRPRFSQRNTPFTSVEVSTNVFEKTAERPWIIFALRNLEEDFFSTIIVFSKQ